MRLAKQLLSDKRCGRFEIRKFPEDEALEVVELIEPTVGHAPCSELDFNEIDPLQILEHPDIPEDLKITAFAMLQELCDEYGRLPRSYLIEEDFEAQEGVPFATHGYTDLWKRDLNGGKFAIKALRFHPDDDSREATQVTTFSVGRSLRIPRGSHHHLQRFCKEVLLWKRLNHPNILAFHGASVNQNRLCIVSLWMENGDVVSYTRKNPEANRLQLVSTNGRLTGKESDSRCLVADRCHEWSQVPSSDGLCAREHSRGVSCCHECRR